MNRLIDQNRIAADAAFSAGEELELAAQALEAVNPARLDQFVAVLVRRAQRRLGPLDPQASAALTQYLREIARMVPFCLRLSLCEIRCGLACWRAPSLSRVLM